MTMQESSHKRYSMIIEWSDEDDVYIVTVPELPGCRTHGSTREEAVRHGEEVIELWLEPDVDQTYPVPPPRTFVYWNPYEPHRRRPRRVRLIKSIDHILA